MSSVEEAAVAAAARLADSCSDVVGTALVSAILHGSLTMDDFQPGRSDLDLLLNGKVTAYEAGYTRYRADRCWH